MPAIRRSAPARLALALAAAAVPCVAVPAIVGIASGDAVVPLPRDAVVALPRAASTGSPAAAAASDAAALLGRVQLPAGSVASSTPPAGTGTALAQPPTAPATPNAVNRREYWTVPGTPADVLTYIAAHPPAGGHLSSSGSGSGPGGPTVTSEGFSFAPTAALGSRTLLIAAAAASPTTTGLLVDGQDVWLTLRPASERVPASAKVVTLTLIRPLGRTGARKSAPLLVTTPSQVARIIAAVNALAAAQPGVYSCPADNGSGFSLAFRARAHGPVLALATAELTGCGGVTLTLGGRPQPGLDGGPMLGATIDRILGIHSLTRAG